MRSGFLHHRVFMRSRGMFQRNSRILTTIAFLFLCGFCQASVCSPTLSAKDVAGIKTITKQFRTGWLKGDAEAVLKTLTSDAVLLPDRGHAPIVGQKAIREFWFPAGARPARITDFQITVVEVAGACDLAYARGDYELTWVTEQNGAAKKFTSKGTYLNVFKRQSGRAWLMSDHMWDSRPTQ